MTLSPSPIASRPQDPGHSDDSALSCAQTLLLEKLPKDAARILVLRGRDETLEEAIRARSGASVVAADLAGWPQDGDCHSLEAIVARPLANAQAESSSIQPSTFDCVVCDSLLDCTPEPLSLLRRAERLLERGGRLLAAAANVRRRQSIWSLLAGVWPPPGGRPETVRWHTRREIEKLFFRAGFESCTLCPAPTAELQQWIAQGRPGRAEIGGLAIDGLADQDAEELHAAEYVVEATAAGRPSYGLTSIVIVTHDQLAYTKACLESIRFRTDEPYEVIVVDNGSSDDTPEWLRAQSDVRLIENADNRGFPAAANQGIRAASGGTCCC